jgi:hypothetical protein
MDQLWLAMHASYMDFNVMYSSLSLLLSHNTKSELLLINVSCVGAVSTSSDEIVIYFIFVLKEWEFPFGL